MDYLSKQQENLYDILQIIDIKISKGKGIKSLRKTIQNQIKIIDNIIETI